MAQHFVDTHIAPLLEEIAHPNLPAVKALLGKLNFFVYSYGTVFVQEIRNSLEVQLLHKGYESADIKAAFAEAYAMHIGPCCRLDTAMKNGNFSAVYVMSDQDLSMRSKTDNWRLLEHFAPGERAKRISDNEIIIHSDLPLQGRFMQETPSYMDTSNEMEAQRYRVHRNPSGHGLRFYTQPTLNGLTAHMPDYVQFCLSTMLEGTPPTALQPEGFAAHSRPKLANYQLAIAELSKQATFTCRTR